LPPSPDRGGRPRVYTIPASVDFADALAQGLIARVGAGAMALADTTIYLPTRRAVRSIAEVFARNAGGATLLPQFLPLGDVDDDEALLGADALELPPAMTPLRRQMLLAALIRRWSHARDGGTMSFAQAASLARSLAGVMDEVERAGADLGKLDTLAPAALAAHWAEVVEFLSLLHREWPPLLAAEGFINPADHRNRSLRALAERLAATAPDRPIVAAGSTGSLPATAELMAIIARLPQGAVVLPGLDRDLDTDSWERLEPNHPQFALKHLLSRLGIARDAVDDWTAVPANGERERLLREVLRPAPTTDAWRALAEHPNPPEPDGISLFEAADPAEEAAVIALLLRSALETPGQRAALITRDRGLARRVAAEMTRWAIAIDDSAGRPLPRTPAGSFLCLLAEAAHEGFAPIALLALLKHPLATMGDTAFRAHVRDLDRALRGPRPDEGLSGIAKALTNAKAPLQQWWARVNAQLAPLETALADPEIDLAALLETTLVTAEALAPALWNGPDGAAANGFFCTLRDGADGLPRIEAKAFAPLLRDLMRDVPVRPSYSKHPRLAILGPLEARLQRFDLVVLGGLNEGSWPAAAADDPWFSRPMRAALGLDPPERSIGLSAHDFAGLAAAPRVVLTRAQKSDGTPMVASRWIQRLQQLGEGLGIAGKLALDPAYRAIIAAMTDPGPLRPEPPPYPRPPVAARPRALSVTDIEKWIRDPYAIYARKILRLKPLDRLDADIGPRERGSAFHLILEKFLRRFPDLPPDAAMQMGLIIDEVFDSLALPQAIVALWRPRFFRAVHWFLAEERKVRPLIAESYLEVRGEIAFAAPAGAFTLSGIADRIDRLSAGGASIIDYKTGTPPSGEQVKVLLSPQLPLEAAILAHGGFAGVPAIAAEELVYIHISGGAKPGKVQAIKTDAAALAGEALERLTRRVALFDRETTGYESHVAPVHVESVGDYDHLARVREWAISGWSGE
jgi:ATP-dependent helicase/nuclease subunit B